MNSIVFDTNEKLLAAAMRQSAIESGCQPEDFRSGENKVVISADSPDKRKYLVLPFYCDLTTYGSNIVASVNEEIADTVRDYITRYPVEHCFQTPNLHFLNDELQKRGMRICFMAEYFLPDLTVLVPLPCEYELRVLTPPDFAELYIPQWSSALCERRKNLDVLAVGAYDHDKLVGLAGCSADCDTMWQIGIDVLPEYRRRGIASAATSRLAVEILQRGKVPFYCAAWSNIGSVRNAIRSGFRPAWIQMTAKTAEFTAGLL